MHSSRASCSAWPRRSSSTDGALRFATPRRLAVLVKGLTEQQPEQDMKRRGPPVTAAFDANGQPTRAALAFAETCGTTVGSLERVQEAEGRDSCSSAARSRARSPAICCPAWCRQRSMRCRSPSACAGGAGDAEFVRPGALGGAALRQGCRAGDHSGRSGRPLHARTSLSCAEAAAHIDARRVRRSRCASADM